MTIDRCFTVLNREIDMPDYSLEDLAKILRINPRTIRSYIQQGLLRGPDSLGRNARYSEYHLKRLRVIRTLKDDHNLPLSEIRRLVTMAGPDEDIQIQLVPTSGLPQERSPSVKSDLDDASASSALDYIRARRALVQGKPMPEESAAPPQAEISESMPAAPPQAAPSPLETLLLKLREGRGLGRVPRRTRGEEWVRLEITPDIEIHVRGQLQSEQLKDFEQLADLMRHILLGSEEND
jgi:DNA-binding transcriptional MerR regulator